MQDVFSSGLENMICNTLDVLEGGQCPFKNDWSWMGLLCVAKGGELGAGVTDE